MKSLNCIKSENNTINDKIIKELTNERNLIMSEISKLTKNILRYQHENHDKSEILPLIDLRTKKNEKVIYINDLLKKLQRELQREKSTYHDILINFLIEEITKFGYTQEKIRQIKKLAIITNKINKKKARKEIHKIHIKADIILSKNDWYNSSGCYDPTAKIAIDSITKKNS